KMSEELLANVKRMSIFNETNSTAMLNTGDIELKSENDLTKNHLSTQQDKKIKPEFPKTSTPVATAQPTTISPDPLSPLSTPAPEEQKSEIAPELPLPTAAIAVATKSANSELGTLGSSKPEFIVLKEIS